MNSEELTRKFEYLKSDIEVLFEQITEIQREIVELKKGRLYSGDCYFQNKKLF